MVDMIAAMNALIAFVANGADEAERAECDVYSDDALPVMIGLNTAYAARHGNVVTAILCQGEILSMTQSDPFDSPEAASEGIDMVMRMYDQNHRLLSLTGIMRVSPIVSHVTFQRPDREKTATPRGWASNATV